MNLKNYWTEERLKLLQTHLVKTKVTGIPHLWDFITANNKPDEEYLIGLRRFPEKTTHSVEYSAFRMANANGTYERECRNCIFQDPELKNIVVDTPCFAIDLCKEIGAKLVGISCTDGKEGKPVYFSYIHKKELFKK